MYGMKYNKQKKQSNVGIVSTRNIITNIFGMKHLHWLRRAKGSILYAFMLSVFMCCTHNTYYSVTENKAVIFPDRVDTIRGVAVYQSEDLREFTGIESVDSFVVLFSTYRDSLIFVMSTNSDSIIGKMGQIGKAKNELIVPMRECQFEKRANGDILMHIDDFNRQCITTFNFSASLANNHLEYVGRTPYKFSNQAEQSSFFSVSDTEYVMFQGVAWANDVRDEKTISPCVYKSSGDRYEIYPQIIGKDDFQKAFIYNIMTKMKPDKSKMLLAHGNIGLFTIVNFDSGNTLGVHESSSYDFDYLSQLSECDKETFFSQLKAYYTSCNVTDEYIILGRDGNHTMSVFDKLEIFQPMICLLDWSGNVIYSFVTNEEVGPIAFNTHNKCLYAIGADNCIYKYDIAKFISTSAI